MSGDPKSIKNDGTGTDIAIAVVTTVVAPIVTKVVEKVDKRREAKSGKGDK